MIAFRTALVIILLTTAPIDAVAATMNQNILPAQPRDLPEALSLHQDSPLAALKKELQGTVERRPEDAGAWHQLGTVLFRLTRETEAKDAWQKAHDLDSLYAPSDLMADVQNVFRLVEQGKTDEARVALAKAEAAHGNTAYFHLIRAEQAMRSKAFDAAEVAYQKAIEVDPTFFGAKLNLGRYLEFVGRQDEARAAYLNATEDAPDHPMTWDFLGAHMFSSGEIEPALESFKRAEIGGALQPLAEVRLANLFLDAKDLIGARHWYQKGLERAGTERNAILVSLGNVQLRLGLQEEATESLDEVLETSSSAPILVARGYLAEENRDFETAISLYRDAVKAEPGNVVASNNLAMALIRANTNPEEALAHSRQALEIRPQNASIAGTYAVALAHAETTDDALIALRRNVRISPGDPWIRYFLAKILQERGQTSEARIHFEAATILDPDFLRIDEVRTMLPVAGD